MISTSDQPTKPAADRRAGFTLFELLLVLAIIVIFLAIATPLIRKAFDTQRLKKSAERVRVECARTRVKAMRTGRIYAFRCVPETGQFFVEPIESYDDTVSSAATVEETAIPTEIEQDAVDPTNLVDGIQFGSVTTVDGMSLPEDAQSLTAEALNASLPVFFYPDGTSSTADIVLQNSVRAISVQIRGLTGTARLSELYQPGEVPE